MKTNLITPHVGLGQRATRRFFNPVWLLAAGLGLQNVQAQLFYESFPSAYTEGEALGGTTSGVKWTVGNSATSSGARIRQVAAMSSPSLVTEPTNTPSHGIQGGTGTGKNRAAGFAVTGTSGTVYASFLFNLQTNNPNAPRLFASLSSGTGPGLDAAVYLDTSSRLLIAKNPVLAATTLPANPTTYSLVPSNTYLVVIRYKYNAGATTNDEVDLWLNPATIGNNANIPAPTLVVTNGTDSTAGMAYFYYLAASSGLNSPVNFFMDEIRVGTNWADVTPTNSIAGNIYTVTGGGSGCLGDSFAVGLSGSDANVSYLLYTNGVYTGVSVDGNGSVTNFGPQSVTAVYTVLATNNLTAGLSWMNSNAVISILSPPTIATQPAPVITATNSTVIYSVSAVGSSLNYQWYRNGAKLADVGHVSGSGTPMLTIAPVTSADAATTAVGYYCVITNRCGYMTISTTNALIIQAASNLVWQGTPANSWDIGTTANWTNSAGTAVAFTTGDNVTFDDSYQSAVVNLASAYLSPGTMTYNASQSIGFSGGGNIFGINSTLQAIGTGTLAISNVNSFAGGTLISNATVLVRNYGALGSGPVNLVGGSLATSTLQIPMAGSASSGLYNPLNVAADSILQFDGTGTYGTVLFGPLTGATGTTLTVNHGGGGPDRLRVYNTNFTFNANLFLNSSGIQLAPYNSAGSQVYNGVISGSGSLIERGSGGNIILNNTNTYTGGTVLSLGSVGLGCDSAGDLSYGPFGTGSVTIDTTSGSSTLFAVNGVRTVGNPIAYDANASSQILVFSGTNQLILSGTFDLGSSNRTMQVNNTAATILSGTISGGAGIIKTGNGALYLDGTDSYTEPTTVSAGRLAGSGSLSSAVQVDTNGVIGGGSAAAIGTLTINSDLTLNGGGSFRLNKSLAQSNDIVSVSGVLTNAGTGAITVTNVGVPALAVGDKFTLFSQAVSNGAAMTITGGGMTWTNHLALDGSIIVGPQVVSGTDLAVGKSGPATVNPAASFSYTLAVSNLGPASASGVVVTDTLPAGLTFVSASGGGVNNSGVVNWALGGMNSSQVSNLTLTVTAPTYGLITNKATVSSTTTELSPANNTSPQVVTTVVPVNTQPHLTNSIAGNNLTLQWPLDHTGFTLQSQTNSLGVGLGSNWVPVGGSSITNQVVIPLDVTKGSVFFRLIYNP